MSAAVRRTSRPPWQGSLLDLMQQTDMWSWVPWRSFAKAITGLGAQMSEEELALYQKHTRREQPPSAPVDEAVMMIGTGGGKSRFASLRAVHAAITFDPASAAKKELVVVPLLAVSMDQARNVMSYVRAFCDLPEVRPYVVRIIKRSVEFKTGVNVEVMPANFGSVRGYTNPCAVLDEIAYWDDQGSNPDEAIVNAVRTRLVRVPGSQLLVLSSPHAPRGVLHQLHEAYFGRSEDCERDRVLFWNASTLAMRPDHPKPHAIEKAFRLDPASAVAEYGIDGFVQFRQARSALFDLEPVTAATVSGRRELPPVHRTKYVAFIDAAQGARSGDSMTLGIAHREKSRGVLDLVREVEPPFSPGHVIATTFAPLLHAYGIREVRGDRVSEGFVSEAFTACGIKFLASPMDKSALYREALALVNSGAVELLDHPTLRTQFLALERRSVRGGRDRIDHPSGGHDDVANAVAGALVMVSGIGRKKTKVARFSGHDTRVERPTIDSHIGEIVRATKEAFRRQDERDWERARRYDDEPMTSEPLWYIHGRG